jgi:predicted NBD/HSP70 family sugar kinase
MSAAVEGLNDIREFNRLRLLEELQRAGVADRSELARLTGLSRATVATLVADFVARGAIVEEQNGDSARAPGRPSNRLRLEPSAATVLGVDFGHRHVRVAIADLSATVLIERRLDLDVDAGSAAALDTTAELAAALLSEAGVDRARVLGAGMGIPAPIDPRSGRMPSASILANWEPIRPGDELERRLGVPVRVANDADLGAIGEGAYGAGRGIDDLLYVKLSAGFGAGLILGGALHPGATGIAGEIGHLGVDPLGVICRCGNRGCLETVASGDGLRAALAPTHGAGLSTARLLALSDAGDVAVLAELERAGRTVGAVLGAFCTAINPSAIVIGGDLGAGSAPLRDAIAAELRRTALPPTGDLAVHAATLGDRAEVLGAITLALDETEWLRSAGLVAVARQWARA